ncbi:MAG: type I methionyl aminopeptidase [Spirochaetales bacterium]|jgi:methionyl aminopeptidase|nr:type I methionyl aminopeptidase [Spirochaetales bacterium]
MIRLKNEHDIRGIRKAGEVLAETFSILSEKITEGVTTAEIDKVAHDYIASKGGAPTFLGYMDYPASVCASVNHVVIHGIPDNRKLESGDILSLDLGVTLDGYIADSARTFRIGEVSEETQKLLKITEQCLYLGIEQATVGNRINNISEAIYGHAKDAGYGVVHQFCGHGVGFSLHEDPQVPNYVNRGPNPRLKPGMVLAIEPMINAGTDEVVILDDDWTVETTDKSLSAHYEHTIAIMAGRTEILTR